LRSQKKILKWTSDYALNFDQNSYVVKNLSLLSFSICLFLCPLFYSSCHEDEDKLPPITTDGRNTLGCLVNGEVWLPLRSLLQGGIYSELETVVDTVGIHIYGDNAKSDDGITISFFDSPTLRTDLNYDLTNPRFHVEYSKDADKQVCFYDSVLSGNVKLLNFDVNSQIISGTFEFKVYNIACNRTVTVSEGRFDLLYNR
jgi:hypothetical protein